MGRQRRIMAKKKKKKKKQKEAKQKKMEKKKPHKNNTKKGIPMEKWMEHNLQYCMKPAAQDPKTEKDYEVINALVNVEQQMLELEGKGDDASVAEKEQLKELEEELIESTFPEGCTWECYLSKHPWVAEHIEHKQEAALEHYKFHAAKKSGEWDCSCKDGQEVNINPELEDLG